MGISFVKPLSGAAAYADIFGAGFMILGILELRAAIIQYGRILRRIESEQFTYAGPFPLPKIVPILLLVMGAFGIWATLS